MVVFDRGRGDMSSSLDFGVPLTGIESVIPGWDAFNPLTRTNFVPQSVSDHKLLAPTTTMLLF